MICLHLNHHFGTLFWVDFSAYISPQKTFAAKFANNLGLNFQLFPAIFEHIFCVGYDYDLYAAPEWHIAFFRILHGILLLVMVREIAKKLIKIIISSFTGPITEQNIRQRPIEVTLNYTVYAIIGFTCAFIAPLMFSILGLYR